MKEISLIENWWQFLLIAVVCYFIGCFNFAKFISRKKNKDITTIGSGNPGTMNMSREFGLKIGVLTFFCDVFKGGLPALVAFILYRNTYFTGTKTLVCDFIRYFCGIFVILGHIFPVTMRFKGGKGVASSMGLLWICLCCENLWFILLGLLYFCFVVWFIATSEWGSLGSFVGVTGLSVIQVIIFYFRYVSTPVNVYTVCLFMLILSINLLVWTAHHLNITRLFSGEEHHTSVKKLAKKK